MFTLLSFPPFNQTCKNETRLIYQKDKMNSSFYAPVHMDFLENHSIEVQLYEIDPTHKNQEKLYSLEIHFNMDVDPNLFRQIAEYVNLNPQHVRLVGNNILHGGEICTLKGRDGYWCWMTPCSPCSTAKMGRCDTTNCPNNILYRRRFIYDG